MSKLIRIIGNYTIIGTILGAILFNGIPGALIGFILGVLIDNSK